MLLLLLAATQAGSANDEHPILLGIRTRMQGNRSVRIPVDDLLLAHLPRGSRAQAAKTLCEQMGMTPKEMKPEPSQKLDALRCSKRLSESTLFSGLHELVVHITLDKDTVQDVTATVFYRSL